MSEKLSAKKWTLNSCPSEKVQPTGLIHTLSWILTVGCTLNRNEPIRFNLSFQTWGRIGTRYRYAQQRDMRGGSSILKEPRERERSLLL
jgi:hypothetical protein